MNILEVGKVKTDFIGAAEGTRIGISSAGILFTVFLNSPTMQEIDEFHSNKSFEIRYTVLNHAVFFMVKIGALNWMDAPYNVKLTPDLELPEIVAGLGLALNLCLVNSPSGQVEFLRIIGLGTDFSQALVKDIQELQSLSVSSAIVDESIRHTLRSHTTRDLLKVSKRYYKVK